MNILEYVFSTIKNLILFSESHTYSDYFIPNFFVKSHNHMTEIEANLFPNGSFNTSLSHGISGIIASLSIALMNGIKIDMQENAIVKLITFLEKYKMYINDKVFWKEDISLEEFYENKSNEDNVFFRDAWCYGVPGISLAYLYAGISLNNECYINNAISNLKNSLSSHKGIYSSSICHGYSGLLQIALLFKRKLQIDIFDRDIVLLKNNIMKLYDEDYRLGFYNIEFYNNEYKKLNSTNILDGVSGVCLSLIDLEINSKTKWKRIFLFD